MKGETATQSRMPQVHWSPFFLDGNKNHNRNALAASAMMMYGKRPMPLRFESAPVMNGSMAVDREGWFRNVNIERARTDDGSETEKNVCLPAPNPANDDLLWGNVSQLSWGMVDREQ
jgi:hypothetical protein